MKLSNPHFLGLFLVGISLLTSCKNNSKPAGEAADATIKADEVLADFKPSPFDTLPVEARLNATNKTFVFKAEESFDRCDAVSIKRRDGKPMKISPTLKNFLSCIDYYATIVNERYLMVRGEKKVVLLDLETGTESFLFAPDSYEDANLSFAGWSPDKNRMAFVSTPFTPEAQTKMKYPTRTRLIVLQLNPDKTAVMSKKNYDIPIQYVANEGDFVPQQYCFWATNTTIRYREFVSDDYEIAEKTKKLVNLTIEN